MVDEEQDPDHRIKGNTTWYCICDCGGFIRTTSHKLKSGQVWNCGCIPMFSRNRLNMVGHTYGKLLVLFPIESRRRKNGRVFTMWMTQCECGRYREAQTTLLRDGKTTCCGHCEPDGGHHNKSPYVYEQIDGVCRIDAQKVQPRESDIRKTSSSRSREGS